MQSPIGFRLAGIGLAAAITVFAAGRNLIPREPGKTPNVWCTWAAQNYMFGEGARSLDPAELEGRRGALHAQDHITEGLILGGGGWARNFFPKARRDLYFSVDDGWDVPIENREPHRSGFLLAPEKFPSYKGTSAARLRRLNEDVKKLGWRGIAVWVAAQESPLYLKSGDAGALRQYWAERIRWSKEAGISYWKVDWGKRGADDGFRKWLTSLAREIWPQMIIEHCVQAGPLNSFPGDGRADPKFLEAAAARARYSAVLRLYDLSPQLGIPTMLERAAQVLRRTDGDPQASGLLNLDDEAVVAAVLGQTMALLRHPLFGRRPGPDLDVFMGGPRRQKSRMDEVVRALHWQRIAPAFAPNKGETEVDPRALRDTWLFQRGEFWLARVIGQKVHQAAAARVSRGIRLPVVKVDGEPPYVIASRHPNGAIAVATLERVCADRGLYFPKADVELEVSLGNRPIGVFGQYRALCLIFDKPIGNKRIWAQDLAGEEATDITKQVRMQGNRLWLTGELIRRVGLAAGTRGDLSDPGLVMLLE